MTATEWKTSLLPRLEGFGLAPYGGGPKGKMPIGGENWHLKLETVDQISKRNGTCPCVGIYPGPESGVEVFDVDGQKAHEFLESSGIDVDATVNSGAWKVFRKSDPYRYKIIFSVEDADKLPQCKKKIIFQKADTKLGIGEEAVEYFYGKQGAIVAGLHKKSGDYYDWVNGPNGNGCIDLPVAPREWLQMRAVIRADKKTEKPKATVNTSKTENEWLDARFVFGGKCPSCGRDDDESCQASPDGKTLLCYHGQTYGPDLAKKPNEHRIEGNGHTLVLRGHEKRHWGDCSLFTIEGETDVNIAADAEIRHELISEFRERISSEIDLFDIFTPTLAHLITHRASALPCDPTAYIMPLLATTASVIGKRVAFVRKLGHEEPCVIWGGNVMRPSTLKSPVAKDPIRPLEIIEGLSIERCKPKDGDDPKDIQLPRRYVIKSTTHAALLTIACQEKTMGLVMYQDELSSLFAEMEKAHNTTMRADLLELWSGGKVSYDTNTRGHLHTPKTAISLFGNIQPDKLNSLLTADGNGNSGGDGLWSRFLWVRPKETVWEDNDIESSITDELLDIFKKLDNITEQKLKLSVDAIAMARPVWNQWEAERPDLDFAESAFMGKLRGYSIRVAGILHLMDLGVAQAGETGVLDTGDRMIPMAAMERSIRLCRYCRGQWQQLQAEMGHSSMPPAVAKFIQKVAVANWKVVTPRDLIKSKIIGRNTTTAEAVDFLKMVAGRWGLGTVAPGRRGGIQWHPPIEEQQTGL
jgi:hypothetical protein